MRSVTSYIKKEESKWKMGDFNNNKGEGSVVRWYKHLDFVEQNKRGKMPINFSRQHDLVVMNMWVKRRKIKLYTWKSPGDWKYNQIDYILVKQCFRNSTRNMLPNFDINSDNNLSVAEV